MQCAQVDEATIKLSSGIQVQMETDAAGQAHLGSLASSRALVAVAMQRLKDLEHTVHWSVNWYLKHAAAAIPW